MKLIESTKTLAAAAFLGLAVSAPVAHSAVINGLLVVGTNQLEDTDVERVVGANGAVKTSGNFAVGDTIQTILRFTTANTTTIGDVLGPPYQINAYAELQVAQIIPLGGGAATLVFAPSGNLGADVFAQIFERTSSLQGSFSQTLAPSAAISAVQSETLIATLGLKEADDFWFANTLLDIGAAAALSSSDPQVANGQFGLSVLADPGSLGIVANGIIGADGNLHDIVGNASAYQLAPGANTGWLVSSNTSAQFSIPEPGTLLLLGAGLFGVGLARRRQALA